MVPPDTRRWRLMRDPGVHVVRLAEPIERGDSPSAIAMLVTTNGANGANNANAIGEGRSRTPILLDAFETALLGRSRLPDTLTVMLRRGFNSELRTVDAAFHALRRLIALGALRLVDESGDGNGSAAMADIRPAGTA